MIYLLLIFTFLMSAFIGKITIPRIVNLARDYHIYDQPNGRKVHKHPIPRLGGTAFLPAVVISMASVLAIASRFGFGLDSSDGLATPQHFLSYFAGAFILFGVGIYDDVHGLSYKVKFLVQFYTAFLLCVSGLWVASFEHIFLIDTVPFWIGMPITILFVVYITNAMNLIDGIDGLASGLSLISLSVAAALCIMSGDILWAMIAISYIGVLLTFFCYNVFGNKNKIFMGDAGSLTLGYTLSFMVLHFWQANPVWNPYLHNIGIVILSTLIIPMLDVVRVFMSRVRDGRNPFLPDKNHIHHKLMRTGLNGRHTMICILLLSLCFVVSNYFVAAYLSQSLIIILDIFLFFAMHIVINWFIYRKERREGIEYDRAM